MVHRRIGLEFPREMVQTALRLCGAVISCEFRRAQELGALVPHLLWATNTMKTKGRTLRHGCVAYALFARA